MATDTGKPGGVFAEIAYLYPVDRDRLSEGFEGRLLAGYPEAELWVTEWANLFRGNVILSVTMTGSDQTTTTPPAR